METTQLRINEAISRYHLSTGKRMSLRQLANKINPDASTYNKVTRYANGNSKFFDLELVAKIAEILNTTSIFLLGLDENL
jgi:hypothetical protein